MVKINVIVKSPHRDPVDVTLNNVHSKNLLEVISNLIGCPAKNIEKKNFDGGIVVAEKNSEAPSNFMGTQAMVQCSSKNMPAELAVVRGTCVFLSEKADTQEYENLSKETKNKLFQIFREATGYCMPGRTGKKKSMAPKSAASAFTFFLKDFYEDRKAQLANQGLKINFQDANQEARECWKKKEHGEKSKYLNMAAQDKLRYNQEMTEWRKKHPNPPKKRNAFSMFRDSHTGTFAEKKTMWNGMSDDEKKPYREQAQQYRDQVLPKQLEAYRQYCEASGKNFAEIIPQKASRKRKISEVSDPEKQPSPKKKQKVDRSKPKSKTKVKANRTTKTKQVAQ